MSKLEEMLVLIPNHEHRLEGHRDLTVKAAVEQGFEFDFEFGEIVGYHGKEVSVTIPTSIAGVEVRGIAERAFKSKGLETLLLSNTIAVVREEAFADNPLRHVILEEGLISVHPTAFRNTKITAIRIPSTIMSLEKDTFYEGSPSASEMNR